MDLQTTISIYAGGPGSGCHGDNCGRKVTLHPVENADFNLRGRDYDSYHAKDERGKVVASVVVRPQGKELEVSWISGPFDYEKANFRPVGAENVRAIRNALKERYPAVERVKGVRITGIHHRAKTEQTSVAWA